MSKGPTADGPSGIPIDGTARPRLTAEAVIRGVSNNGYIGRC